MKVALTFSASIGLFLCTWYFGHQGVGAREHHAKTPYDYEGPFYPVHDRKDEDNDLTRVTGRSGRAEGKILHLRGIVIDTSGKPREGVTIEIWQTDPKGRYMHPGDSSPGERDENFQYWGEARTGTDGEYSFTTIIPGGYSRRPPHIHFKLWKGDELLLTSQIYFKNHPGYEGNIPKAPEGRELQTVALKRTESGEFQAFFRIVVDGGLRTED